MGTATQRMQGSCQSLQTLDTNLCREPKREENNSRPRMLGGQLKTIVLWKRITAAGWADVPLQASFSLCGRDPLPWWA